MTPSNMVITYNSITPVGTPISTTQEINPGELLTFGRHVPDDEYFRQLRAQESFIKSTLGCFSDFEFPNLQDLTFLHPPSPDRQLSRLQGVFYRPKGDLSNSVFYINLGAQIPTFHPGNRLLSLDEYDLITKRFERPNPDPKVELFGADESLRFNAQPLVARYHLLVVKKEP